MDIDLRRLALFWNYRAMEEEDLANRVIADRERGIREGRWAGTPQPGPDLTIWIQAEGGPKPGPSLGVGAEWVLADIQAKRALALMLVQIADGLERTPLGIALAGALAKLAEPYASHPDFRPEWRL